MSGNVRNVKKDWSIMMLSKLARLIKLKSSVMRNAPLTIHITTSMLISVKSVLWENTLILRMLHARPSTTSQFALQRGPCINKKWSHASPAPCKPHNTILIIINALNVPIPSLFLTPNFSFAKSVQKDHTIAVK